MSKTSRQEFATFVVAAAILAVAGIIVGTLYLMLPRYAMHGENKQQVKVSVTTNCPNDGIPTVYGNG